MADAPLHPIVISPIVSGSFECSGNGLLHNRVECEQPSVLKDLLVPTKVSKHSPIQDKERPKKWWKAQCLHYGLQAPASASISTYRVYLENAIRQRGGIKRPQELLDLEFEQNKRFKQLNAEARDASSSTKQGKVSKAKAKGTEAQAPITTAGSSKKRKANSAKVEMADYEETAKPPKKKARTTTANPTLDPTPSSSEAVLQTARKGKFRDFFCGYELKCTSTKAWPTQNNSSKPSLTVFTCDTYWPWCYGSLKIPGFMICAYRIASDQPVADDGFIRFEWCGMQCDDRKPRVEPIASPKRVGWLKLDPEKGTVKGMIKGYRGEFTFEGIKWDSSKDNYRYDCELDWNDYSGEDFY